MPRIHEGRVGEQLSCLSSFERNNEELAVGAHQLAIVALHEHDPTSIRRTFTDVSKESGVAAMRGSYGLTACAFDMNEDGWPDIFLACDSTPSLLLMNNHDGTFREEALLRGVALSNEGKEMAGMGVGVGDYDCDGHLDIVRTHYMNQPTGLYHNQGKGEFEDVTAQAGLIHERRFVSWGTGLVDLDNDGNCDIFLVTGQVYPELEAVLPKYPRRGQ